MPYTADRSRWRPIVANPNGKAPLKLEMFIGLRYLRAKSQQRFVSFISFMGIVGVALGVAVLIATMAILTGFAGEIQSKIAGTNAHILVAEDNPLNQELTLVTLRKTRCQTTIVDNGVKALEVLEREHVDLVLMDCQMPEMDGYTATEELRRREGPDRHTVVIAMTAHVLKGDREKCLAAGMDDYLSKPVRTEALRDLGYAR